MNTDNFDNTGRFTGYALKCTYCGKEQIRNSKPKTVACLNCRKIRQKFLYQKRKKQMKGGADVKMAHSSFKEI